MFHISRNQRRFGVYILYSDDFHQSQAQKLANVLQGEGVDAKIDLCKPEPGKEWLRRIERQIARADFVLVICTEELGRQHSTKIKPYGFEAKGVPWPTGSTKESRLIFIVFTRVDIGHISKRSLPYPCYRIDSERIGPGTGNRDEGYRNLYRSITGKNRFCKRNINASFALKSDSTPLIAYTNGKRGPDGDICDIYTIGEPVQGQDRSQNTANYIDLSLSALRPPGELFVGRISEINALDSHLTNRTINVVSLEAPVGVGKSALVIWWLLGLLDTEAGNIKRVGARNIKRIFGWSFSNVQPTPSRFFEVATVFFAGGGLDLAQGRSRSALGEGRRLAQLVRAVPSLLVLDGLEETLDPQTGEIRDEDLRILVRELAIENQGLCVITSSMPLKDIAYPKHMVRIELDGLQPEESVKLLKRLDVKGTKSEFLEVAKEYGGSTIALTLLATYIQEYCTGDIRQRDTIPASSYQKPSSANGIRMERLNNEFVEVMEAQIKKLKYPERILLKLIGFFGGPAERPAIERLFQASIEGLTEDGKLNNNNLQGTINRLQNLRLLDSSREGDNILSAHPLIQRFFGRKLRDHHRNAWQEGNLVLFDYYRNRTTQLPGNLSEMRPLFAAVVHGCRADQHQRALDEVFWPRIRRYKEHFSVYRLGAWKEELVALAAFYDLIWEEPKKEDRWTNLPCHVTSEDRRLLLSMTSQSLRALGRLHEAVGPMKKCLEESRNEPREAAVCAGDLSELYLFLGAREEKRAIEGRETSRLDDAERLALEGLDYACHSCDLKLQVSLKALLATILHQKGDLEKSEDYFREAESLQKDEAGFHRNFLDTLRGYRYCDLLIDKFYVLCRERNTSGSFDIDEACDTLYNDIKARAKQLVANRDDRLDETLRNLLIGRLGILCVQSEVPPMHDPFAGEDIAINLDDAVDGFNDIGQELYIPWALIARAHFQRLTGKPAEADRDLQEALVLAECSSMRLHECDIHLEWARLHHQRGGLSEAKRHAERAQAIAKIAGYGRRQTDLDDLRYLGLLKTMSRSAYGYSGNSRTHAGDRTRPGTASGGGVP